MYRAVSRDLPVRLRPGYYIFADVISNDLRTYIHIIPRVGRYVYIYVFHR